MSDTEYKRLMSKADDRFAIFLQEVLDREDTSYEDKLAIMEWFESFDYLTGKETTLDLMLRQAGRLNW